MNRRACALQAQSPGARDDSGAEDLRSNAARCAKRRATLMHRIAIRPCSAAPGNAAQGNVAPPLNDGKSSPAKTTTPLRPAKISCAASNSCSEHNRNERKRGPESPLFLRPRKTGAGQTPDAAMSHPSAAAAAGAERRTRPTSDGIPRAFPRPMKRCSALLLFPDAALRRAKQKRGFPRAWLRVPAPFPRGVFRKSAGSYFCAR